MYFSYQSLIFKKLKNQYFLVVVLSCSLLFPTAIFAGSTGKKIVSARLGEVPVYDSPNGSLYKMLSKNLLINKEILKKQGKWLEIKVDQQSKWVKSLHVSLKKGDIKRRPSLKCDHFKEQTGSTRGLGSC